MSSDSQVIETDVVASDDSIHLAEYFEVVRRNIWLILGFGLVAMVVAGGWSSFQIPMYSATAKVVIEARTPKVLRTEVEQGYGVSPTEAVQEMTTQVSLMKSFPILQETVKRLRVSEQPEYLPRPSRLKEFLKKWTPGLAEYLYQVWEVVKAKMAQYLDDDAEHATGDNVREGLEGEFPERRLRSLVKRFAAHVNIDPVPSSKIIQIRVESESPLFAARAATTLANVYIDKTLETSVKTREANFNWFTTHLDDLRAKVEESEQALYEYRSKHQLVNVRNQMSVAEQKLEQLTLALVQAETKRSEAETRYQQIQRLQKKLRLSESTQDVGSKEFEALTQIMNSPTIQGMRTREIALAVEVAQLSEKYGSLHPKLIRAQIELREHRALMAVELEKIFESIKNEYELALAQEAVIRTEFEKQKVEKLKLDQHTVQYSLLERDANSNRQLYDLFLKQMRETDISTEIKSTNIYLAEPALPPTLPFRPNTLINVLVGLLVGLTGGVGLSFFMDYWNRTLKGPEDVERYLAGLPFLGWVPYLSRMSEQNVAKILLNDPLSAAGDAYRHIRTSLYLSSPDSSPLSVVISSAGAQEGKTSLAANLAVSLSQMEDSKVVLVDADLRRPRLGKIFGVENREDKIRGLAQYLTGDLEVSEILRQTDIPNLALITSGGTPPNHAELLHSKRLGNLIQWCVQRGFHIIFDAPPILPLPDARVIAEKVNGAILVVAAEHTFRDAAQAAVQELSGKGSRLLGLVMQKVPPDRISRYGRYRYYYSSQKVH